MKETNDEIITIRQLDQLLQDGVDGKSASQKRIADVVNIAKKEVGVRDILTHFLIKIWLPILSLGSIFFVFLNRKK